MSTKCPLGDNSPPLRNTDQRQKLKDILSLDFPCGAVDKNPPVNAEDIALIPGLAGFRMPRRSWALEHHSYWACSLENMSCNYWAHELQLLEPAHLEPVSSIREATAMRSPHTATRSSPSSQLLEKAHVQWESRATKNIKLINYQITRQPIYLIK